MIITPSELEAYTLVHKAHAVTDAKSAANYIIKLASKIEDERKTAIAVEAKEKTRSE